MSDKKKIKYKGAITLRDAKIDCYVLEDGSRMLSSGEIARSLDFYDAGEPNLFCAIKNSPLPLQSVLSSVVIQDRFAPVICEDDDGVTHELYEALLLIEVCDALVEARVNKSLPSELTAMAKEAEMLLRGFALVGTTALVDEVTSHKPRAAEYQEIMKQHLDSELKEWVSVLQEDFFKEVCRLKGWDFTQTNKIDPKLIAGCVNELVYAKLPVEIADELAGLKAPVSGVAEPYSSVSLSKPYNYLMQHLSHLLSILRLHGDGEYVAAKTQHDTLVPDAIKTVPSD